MTSQTLLHHKPVLLKEVLEALRPRSGGHYLDGTLGAGGHAEGILEASMPDGVLAGFDIDQAAILLAEERLSPFKDRLTIAQSSYIEMKNVLADWNWPPLDGILLDLGASSMQFDQAERGFSFQNDGPLDMRFDSQEYLTASIIVNEWAEEDIAAIIRENGEEPRARKVAQAIVAARPIESTAELAKIVARGLRAKRGRIHPATKTFQALRIAVNSELENIRQVLPDAISLLSSGGRLAVISFHSLEDRIVKQFIVRESKDCICPPEQIICTCDHQASVKRVTKKPIQAQSIERTNNPRARSAKLRVAERL